MLVTVMILAVGLFQLHVIGHNKVNQPERAGFITVKIMEIDTPVHFSSNSQ